METTVTYYLKINYQPEQETCTLLLQWNERQQQIIGVWNYPTDVINQYKSWKTAYESYYSLQHQANLSQGGSIPFIPTGDPYQDVKKQEDQLLHLFKSWLQANEGQAIEYELKKALNRWSSSETEDQEHQEKSLKLYLEYEADPLLADSLLEDLQILPWERWAAGLGEGSRKEQIQVLRTPTRSRSGPQARGSKSMSLAARRSPKTRILAILADDPTVRTDEYWQQFQALRAIAHVERATWDPNGDRATILRSIMHKIEDDRGWDMLFFAGHSGDINPSGTFQLTSTTTSNITVSMNDIWESLEKAQQNGLQVAIFNSCRGFSLGSSCVNFGFQALVMREKLPQNLAIRFLNYFTQALLDRTASNGHDVHSAMVKACEELVIQDNRLEFPSGQLLPCFFSPADQAPARIRPMGWRSTLRPWIPKPWQGIATGAIVLMSYMIPVQDILIDLRHLSQAVYRDATKQGIEDNPAPPVHIIAINQASINQARATQDYSELYSNTIDRKYLASIIDTLVNLGIKTIGINYYLHTREANQSILDISLKNAVRQQVQLILAMNSVDKLPVHEDTASPNWSLVGDIKFMKWALTYPHQDECQSLCPFSYLSSLSRYVREHPNSQSEIIPLPFLESQKSIQSELIDYIEQNNKLIDTPFLRQGFLGKKPNYLVDFSLPPTQIYQRTSSGELLSQGLDNADVDRQVVLIGAGGYIESDEKPFPLPSATYYWRWKQPRPNDQDFPTVLTGTENSAYMIHHFLEDHLIARVPSIVMLGAGVIVGQITMVYMWNQTPGNSQRRIVILMILGTGLISLQLYVSAKVAVPWLLPSVLYVIYTVPILKRQINV